MKSIKGRSRRAFLQWALTSCALLSKGAAPAPAPRDDARKAARAALGVFETRDCAAAIGAAYLRSRPAEGDLVTLLERIRPEGWRALLHDRAASEWRGEFARLNREDFAHGRVVAVEGWVLAQTEARLCALAALQ
jgi:hypothetical protein